MPCLCPVGIGMWVEAGIHSPKPHPLTCPMTGMRGASPVIPVKTGIQYQATGASPTTPSPVFQCGVNNAPHHPNSPCASLRDPPGSWQSHPVISESALVVKQKTQKNLVFFDLLRRRRPRPERAKRVWVDGDGAKRLCSRA